MTADAIKYFHLFVQLKVRYHSVPGGTFTEDNLQVTLQVNGVSVTWTPVTTDKENIGGNLKGTLRVGVVSHTMITYTA